MTDEQIESGCQVVSQSIADQGLTLEKAVDARNIYATVYREGNAFSGPEGSADLVQLRNYEALYLLTEEDYTRWTGESLALEKGTAAVIPENRRDSFPYDTVQIGDRTWKAEERTDETIQMDGGDVIKCTYLIFRDEEEMQ